jgi:hypothetical protein
MRDEGFALRNE